MNKTDYLYRRIEQKPAYIDIIQQTTNKEY